MFKLVLIILVSLLLHLPARAETISLARGISLDTWLTWPADARLADPGIVSGFPEWRERISDTQLATIKATGFDFVRLPIDPAIFLWPANADKRKTLLSGTMQAVQRLKAAGLKVVVDVHAQPVAPGWRTIGSQTYLASDTAFLRYINLIEELSHALSEEDPARVALELMNEPTLDCAARSWNRKDRWPALLLRLHKAARKAAPRLTLVLSGACWGSAAGLARIDPRLIQDDNVVWSFHNYEPFIFTHQGAAWTGGGETYVTNLEFPPNKKQRRAMLNDADARIAAAKLGTSQKARLRRELRANLERYFNHGRRDMEKPFAIVQSWARKHKIAPNRIVLGEFGAHRPGGALLYDDSRARYLRAVRRLADDAGFAWSVWSWSGTFSLSASNDGHIFAPKLTGSLGLN